MKFIYFRVCVSVPVRIVEEVMRKQQANKQANKLQIWQRTQTQTSTYISYGFVRSKMPIDRVNVICDWVHRARCAYAWACMCCVHNMRSACLLMRQNGVVCKTHSVLFLYTILYCTLKPVCIINVTSAYFIPFSFPLRLFHIENHTVDSVFAALFCTSLFHWFLA